ncbi:hypothetical protein B0T16DRAFT_199834 [Cercophora newfieldiana]|uniref:Uncharacterized protein n=1 Tax=Cercophora newfieldiana TaxID=92897 RepID=A0AA40CPN5_9PEZI|nr:hypothetical protein B0T16DRAFT_199834 [Cercophora newfieldiana]
MKMQRQSCHIISCPKELSGSHPVTPEVTPELHPNLRQRFPPKPYLPTPQLYISRQLAPFASNKQTLIPRGAIG